MTANHKALSFCFILFLLSSTSGLYLLIFPEYIKVLHEHWTTLDDLDMGYPLLCITFFFIYKNLDDVSTLNARPIYLIPLFFIAIVLSLANLLDIKSVFFLAFYLSYPVVLIASLGTHATLLPLTIIGMAMPFWYLALGPLQATSVMMVSAAVNVSGLPALIEGNFITIPGGVIHIAGGCSGLKYFLTSLALSLIYTAAYRKPISFALKSIVIAALTAMAANWIRIFILVLVGHYSGMDHPWMEDHDNMGWVIFACAMFAWIYTTKLLDKNHLTTKSENNATTTPPTEHRRTILTFIIAIIILFTPTYLLKKLHHSDIQATNFKLPDKLGKYTRTQNATRNWQPNFWGADNTTSESYQFNEKLVDVNVLKYRLNSEIEMASGLNTIFNPETWRQLSNNAWQDPNQPDIKIRIATGKNSGSIRIVYYWYNHGDYSGDSILSSKLYQLLSQFKGTQSAELVALSIACENFCQPTHPRPDIKELIYILKELLKK